jgi:ribosomal protein S18 acetylase RimI-like enzyme
MMSTEGNEYLKLERIEGEPSAEDIQVITRGMLAHHSTSGHPRNEEVLSILIRGKGDEVMGAVIGSCLFGRMHVRTLWVDESVRGTGWGRRLMEVAEAEAVRRGCTHAYTDTFSWQAPEFYKKLGYEVYGVLENYPPGSSLIYLSKAIGDQEPRQTGQRVASRG